MRCSHPTTERVVDRIHLTKKQTEGIMGILLGCIAEASREVDKVELRGFGGFNPKNSPMG